MALDITTPESVGWWLNRLVQKLQDEQWEYKRLERLFNGDHDLPAGVEKFKESYRDLQKQARANYLSLVVEAPLDLMRVVGFRSGATGDDIGDHESWDIWQKAHLDADQVMVHRNMLALSKAYVAVGPHPRKKGEILITAEHPSQITTESYPDDRRDIRAGLKLFVDLDGFAFALLQFPDKILKFKSSSKVPATGFSRFSSNDVARWEMVSEEENPWGQVMIVPFTNRPDLQGQAKSEFHDAIDIQNRINTTLLHRLVAERFGTFRQKAILNLALENKIDENGEFTDELNVPELPLDPATAWMLDGEHLQLFEFSQTDTKQILEAVTNDVRDLASITRTPPTYLLAGIVNASGDALQAAQQGLVAKVRERQAQAGESWEQVIRLAHLVKGDADRFEAQDSEVLWADPEHRSMAEVYDAAVKAKAADVPWRSVMLMLGKSPQEIARMEAERSQDAFNTALAQPIEVPNAGNRSAT